MVNTSLSHDITELKDGQSCVPGKVYKLECNNCKCGLDNELVCTKVACLRNRFTMKKFIGFRKSNITKQPGRVKSSEKAKLALPALLKTNKCTAGKVYQYGCNKCFCDSKRSLMCTTKGCQSKLASSKSTSALTLSDIRPELTEDEAKTLPELPNFASRCEPGKTFRVDCNNCVCLYNRVLVCDTTLCLSVEDMNRLQAKKNSGQPCNNNNDIKKINCLKCACVDSKTECKPEGDCIPERIIESRRLQGNLDMQNQSGNLHLEKKDICIPGAVYRNKCNMCYCQENESLRCTQKTCLNYLEALKLQKQRLFLEKHGF